MSNSRVAFVASTLGLLGTILILTGGMDRRRIPAQVIHAPLNDRGTIRYFDLSLDDLEARDSAPAVRRGP